MPFPWSEDTETPQDGAKSGDSWGCVVWIFVLPPSRTDFRKSIDNGRLKW